VAHVFFDLDRTLWHHERNHAVFFTELHAELGLPGLAKDWASNYLAINDRLWDHIQLHNLGVEFVRARRFALLFSEMNLPVGSAKEVERLSAHCEAQIKQRLPDLGEGYEGVNEAFAALHSAGHQLHILTNGVREPQVRKIAALGLAEYLNELVTSDLARAYKPDPKIFTYALRRVGAEPSKAWMVGDSVLRDVLGGQGVGMRTAWFCAPDALPPDAEGRADVEFSDWQRFPEQLQAAMDRS
jgi:putative hydrolase of the HAD superfamily